MPNSNTPANNNNISKATKSGQKGRRKGLEEVFPGIKLNIQQSKSVSNMQESHQRPTAAAVVTTQKDTNGQHQQQQQKRRTHSPSKVQINNPNEYTKIYWTDESNSKMSSSGSSSSCSGQQLSNSYHQLNSNTTSEMYTYGIEDPDWCPASDLCDFDLDEAELEAIRNTHSRKGLVLIRPVREEKKKQANNGGQQVASQANNNVKSTPLMGKQHMGNKNKIVKNNADLILPIAKNINSFYY